MVEPGVLGDAPGLERAQAELVPDRPDPASIDGCLRDLHQVLLAPNTSPMSISPGTSSSES